MAFTKKVTKTPAVRVETRKLPVKDTCDCDCSRPCCSFKHLLVPVLLVINMLLLVWVLVNQVNIEAGKVGGRQNYKMVQEIYKSDSFKQQQAQQIQQALQLYQGNGQVSTQTTQQTTTPTDQQAVQAVPAQ